MCSAKTEGLLWNTVTASNSWGILAMLVVSYSLQDNYFQSLALISLAAPAGGAAGKKRSWTNSCAWMFSDLDTL